MELSHDTTKHILQVIAVNIAAISITWSDLNKALSTLSLVIGISYGLYKWWKEIKSNKKPN